LAGIVAIRYKADVLAIRLVGYPQPVSGGQRPGLGPACKSPQRQAEKSKLDLRDREREIVLVAVCLRGDMQHGTMRPVDGADIMARRHAIGIKITRGLKQVTELDAFITADAGNRCCAGKIGVSKLLDYRFTKLVFVIQNVMRKTDTLGHTAGVMDILPGAAGT